MKMNMRKTAWLVELRGHWPKWLRMSQGGFEWTTDANEAMKFADRKSAEQAAEESDVDIIITEHEWPEGF